MKSSGIIASLCDKTGNMLRPWAEAGYTCYAVDIQHSIRKDRVEQFPGGGCIHYVWGDARSWTPPAKVLFGFGFTPCTHVAVSGSRDFQKKAWPMFRDGLDLFHSAVTAFEWARCAWMCENPIGRIAGIMGKSEHIFSPWEFTDICAEDNYNKDTCIWTGGGFIFPPNQPHPKVLEAVQLVCASTRNKAMVTKEKALALLPDNALVVEWYPDDRIHRATPGEGRADERSATPMGFARAVFAANTQAPGEIPTMELSE